MPTWIVTSLVLSLVLTIALNLLPRLFPGASRRASESLERRFSEQGRVDGQGPDGRDGARVRVFFPWKWMLGLSIAGTLLLNLLL